MIFYFFYVIIFGGYFSLRYLFSEKKIKSSREFVLLLFFPMAGYGNWLYNKALRESISPVLPRKWFIWRKMIRQNLFLLLFSVLVIVLLVVETVYLQLSEDGAINFYSGSFSVKAKNIDPTLGLGLIFSAFASIFYFCFFLFLLVLIPRFIARNIKKNHKSIHY